MTTKPLKTGATYDDLPAHDGRAGVRAAPFDAIELELGALWI
jgi:hypothetical protein